MNLIALVVVSSLWGATPTIDVVYPRIAPGDTVPRLDKVDSNFVFGNVQPPDARLWINGAEVIPRHNGAFLAFLPVDWQSKKYVVSSRSGEEQASLTVPFAAKPIGAPPVAPSGEYPRLIELSSTPLRSVPNGTYFIFPAAGTRVLATGWEDGYYRVPLSSSRSGWAEAKSSKDLGKVPAPPTVIVTRLMVDTLADDVIVRIPSNRKLLVSLRDESDQNRLVLELYGAVSRIDRIGYSPLAPLVREIFWEQPSDGVLRLDIRLTAPLWGYYGVWEEKAYVLHLRKKPRLDYGLTGMLIAVDAGHGGTQDGSIGPMRIKEKDVNLGCALALQKRLESLGARVLMTRIEDSLLGLTERTGAAQAAGAQLLISLHHNALPDGIDPFGPGPFGVGVHYYRSESLDFAMAVKQEVVQELGLPDEGVFYSDLALARPSFCPSILLEAAYMMLPEQEEIVSSPSYPDRFSSAVVKGIERFIEGSR